MVKRMLIDATHLEETRVVIASGTRLDEFDFESSTKKQLKGNIYLAKVTRVEPSLQAAFVDFGGNRHGFLPFSEIHPDYYQIPVADRMALLAEQQRMGSYGESDADFEPVSDRSERAGRRESAEPREAAAESSDPAMESRTAESSDEDRWNSDNDQPSTADLAEAGGEAAVPVSDEPARTDTETPHWQPEPEDSAPWPEQANADGQTTGGAYESPGAGSDHFAERSVEPGTGGTMPLVNPSSDEDVISSVVVAGEAGEPAENGENGAIPTAEGDHVELRETPQHVEVVGGADEVEAEVEGAAAERRRGRPGRHRYKIQEVIKRRQILLVQVVKEERGNKGAALTTYLSLAGRYCVLMPNTARGGGISRKISSPADRKRLKSHLDELEIPEGMAVILRTAAVERSKTELKRDYEYLLRQWDEVRELTLKSIAPALVYEEANLIKRSIRDHYTKDVDEVLVEGDEGYRTAKEFMRMLMPSHAKKVQQYRDPEIPLFHRYQIESQLDAMHNPVVTLKSGGYIVINPTEALVAIDVNSGRATRERNIEETAYKTNLEAADEIARQLRLRDLAGLIVIDFIDMEESRNQHNVEKRLKDAMRVDRARIQIGKISAFGLLELSRQRLRPSFLEASTERCPHCAGTGLIRSTESAALHVIRAVEEEGIRRRSSEIRLVVPTTVALYILNHKRAALVTLEARYSFHIVIDTDDTLIPPNFRLERLKAQTAPPPSLSVQAGPPQPEEQAEIEAEDEIAAEAEEDESAEDVDAEERDESAEVVEARSGEPRGEGDKYDERRRRPQRRRRGRGSDDRGDRGRDRHERNERPAAHGAGGDAAVGDDAVVLGAVAEPSTGELQPVEGRTADTRPGETEAARKRRRRGKRGGRRRRRHEDGAPDAARARPQNDEGRPSDEQPQGQADVPTPPRHESPDSSRSFEPYQPAARQGNGRASEDSHQAASQAPSAPSEPRATGSAQPAPAQPESQPASDRSKRKGWWQRLTQ